MESVSSTWKFGGDEPASTAALTRRFVPMPRFDVVTAGNSERPGVEQYIQDTFRAAYGAAVQTFMPAILSVRCNGQLSGVAGVTLARYHQDLFLENYLDTPIEQALSQLAGNTVARNTIAEVGNLAATAPGVSRLVFVFLATALHRLGLQWMVFTATAPLLASLQKLGFQFAKLAPAELSRLPESSAAEWGSYYAHKPWVVAGRLDHAMELIGTRTLDCALQFVLADQIDAITAKMADELVAIRP